MLETITYNGVPEGSNLAVPPHEIADTQARYIQDGLLDEVGLLYRRGIVTNVFGVATLANEASGITHTVRPDGTHKVAVLHGPSAAKLAILSDDYSSSVDVDWFGTLPTAPYYYVDAKPLLGGGSVIGTSRRTDSLTPVQALGFWHGASKANYSTGTITVTRGSKTVTGSGTAWIDGLGNRAIEPGMYLFGTSDDPAITVYFGIVKSVDSATQLTLMENPPWAATAKAYTLKPVRGFCPRYTIGRITTATTATLVTGAATKFKDNSLGTGTWAIFRATDMAFVGKVSAVTSNTAITLTANAAIALDNEGFVALRADGDYSLDTTASTRKVGFLTALHKERQFYANLAQSHELTYRLWISESDDPESIDLDPVAGNFIDVTSAKAGAVNTPIASIAPASNSLLILKENESFSLDGSSPDDFTLRKLSDDGCLSPMSVQQYAGGVLYAGRNGIYFYDGVQPTNIGEQRLGVFYRRAVRSFDPNTYRMWSMVVDDHYILHIESATPSYKPQKGNTTATATSLTIDIYMPTMSVTFHTNMALKGAVEMPPDTQQATWFLVNTASGARICSTRDLFETQGQDTITCIGSTAGPDWYLESKRYDLGDPLRKKLFKQLQLHYYVSGDDLKFDTVTGLNDNGITSLSRWAKTVPAWHELPSTIASTWDALTTQYDTWDDLGQPRFKVKRLKFLKRSQHFGFRIYQASSNVRQVKLGPWAIGFKLQRPGRT